MLFKMFITEGYKLFCLDKLYSSNVKELHANTNRNYKHENLGYEINLNFSGYNMNYC